MSWFKRMKGGITTSTKNKKETPEGLWHKCIGCKEIVPSDENQANLWVCKSCGHHQRISAGQYFSLLFDDSRFFEFNSDMTSADPLGFVDTKPYKDRLVASQEKSGLKDAARTAYGTMEGEAIVIAAMDFAFIGGSMGAVVGEKFARAIDKAMELNCPLMIISKSGGARMMEAAFSLMQMAKTSAKLSQLAKKGLPYISFLTDPTTGGITASFAMLGDLNVAEPGALIGFAGPRVVKETIGKDLPEGFQTSEFVLEHGFLDLIILRSDLKSKLAHLLSMMKMEKVEAEKVEG